MTQMGLPVSSDDTLIKRQSTLPRVENPPRSFWIFVLTLATLFGSFAGAVSLLVFYGSLRLDEFAKDDDTHHVQTALAEFSEQVRFVAGDYSYWTSAAKHLIVSFDGNWADENVGRYAYTTLKFSRSLVLDQENRPVFGMTDGKVTTAVPQRQVSPEILTLAARAREGRRDGPAPSSAFLWVDGKLMAVAAAPITFEKQDQPPGYEAVPRGVLIFMRALDDAAVSKIKFAFGLGGLTFRPAGKSSEGSGVPLLGPSGQAVAVAFFAPERPGRLFLRDLAPWVLSLLLITIGLAALVLRRAYVQLRLMNRLNGALHRRTGDLERSRRELVVALEEAKHADKTKSDFLAFMSHELRTPLNAIIGFSDMMSGQILGPIGNPRYREYSRDINESGRHLLSLITDILDLSRVEAGRLELHKQMVDLADAARSCAGLIQNLLDAHRARVRIDAPAGPIMVELDPLRTKQIILNLLTNAVKSTGIGDDVKVRITMDSEGKAVLRVIDRGRGISADELKRVLEPFHQAATYRVPERSSDVESGSGLGLSIVRKLVEAHGGHFRLRSKVGLGTVAEVNFGTTACNAGHSAGSTRALRALSA